MAYLAGVIDCDGSITIWKKKNNQSNGVEYLLYPEMKISNSNRKLIDFFKMKFPFSKVTKDNRHECYYLSVVGTRMFPILNEIRNYLVAKQEQCDLIIEFITSRLNRDKRYAKYSSREIEIVENVQKLNKKG